MAKAIETSATVKDKKTLVKIGEWMEANKALNTAKLVEMSLRKEIFKQVFKDPREGTNLADLPDDWKLKGTHRLNRNIDAEQVDPVLKQLRAMKYGRTDKLVIYKPNLSQKEYNELTEEQRQVFDECLTIEPGTPALELVAPKPTE